LILQKWQNFGFKNTFSQVFLPDYENMGPPSKPCFGAQILCIQILCIRSEVSVIGYGFTKLGIGSKDLRDVIVTMLDQ
jgi:hypothetical protein